MTTETPNPILHHVNLKTTRVKEMAAWYATVIGMKVNLQGPDGVLMSNDAAHHRLALINLPGLADDSGKTLHSGMHHSAFEYPSVDGLVDTYERLKGEGILPHACFDHGMTMSFYYADPDGNSVELQYDTFGDWDKSTAFMRTIKEEAVAVNPELVVAARRAGASAEEIHERAYEKKEFLEGAPVELLVDPPTA